MKAKDRSPATMHLKRHSRETSGDLKTRLSTNDSLSKLSKKEPGSVWFCCRKGRTDARLIQYLATLIFSFIILVFCIVQMIRLEDPHSQNTYISLITLVFGIFIPHPKMEKNP